MHDDRVDPEALAALLDGTLTGNERARVVELLARSDEAYADLLETAELRDELSAGHGGAAPARDTGPFDGVRRRWRRRGVLVAVPALAAAAALLMIRGSGPPADGGFAAADAVAGPGPRPALASGWSYPDRTAVRGTSGLAGERARAFDLGAHGADLDIAAAAGDTLALRGAAAILARLTENVPTGRTVALRLENVATAGAPTLSGAERSLLLADLRSLAADTAWFDIGRWGEAARVAAQVGRSEFFRTDGPAMRELDRLARGANTRTVPAREAATLLARFRDVARQLAAGRADPRRASATIDSAMAANDR